MRTTQEYTDKTAISLSLICVAHCLFMPSFLVLLSSYISFSYDNELVHYLVLAMAIPLSLYALIAGVRNHKTYSYFLLGLFGLLCVIFAISFGVQFWGELGEESFTTIGALLVAFFHFKNYRLCRQTDWYTCH